MSAAAPDRSPGTIVPTAPNDSTRPLLPGAGFVDAWSVDIDEPDLDAIVAARRVFARQPAWVARLTALRDLLVAQFALKTAADARVAVDEPDRIGFFPILSRGPERVVLGLDDRHLDFRVALDVATTFAGKSRITATTLVRTHNNLGRIYLAVVTPFHRAVVPAMLAQAVRP